MSRRRIKRKAKRKPEQKLEPARFIGVAVLTAQFFEIVFVLVARVALKHPGAETLEDIAPLSKGAFKQATTALVKELLAAEHISAELAERIKKLAEDRHLLIHRMLFAKVEESISDEDFFEALIHLSRRVYSESLSIASLLLASLIDFTARFPEAASHVDDLRATLARLAPFASELRAKIFSSDGGGASVAP